MQSTFFKEIILKNNLVLSMFVSILIVTPKLIVKEYNITPILNTLFLLIPLLIFIYSLKVKSIVAQKPVIQCLSIMILVTIFIYQYLYKPSQATDFFIILIGLVNLIYSVVLIPEIIPTSKKTTEFNYTDNYSIDDLVEIYKSNIYKITKDNHYVSFYDIKINKLMKRNNEFIDFITYCKDNDINFLKMTKDDFSVYTMMKI